MMATDESAEGEAELRKLWPLAFNNQRRPLKIGIDEDMNLVGRIDAMRHWVNHPVYLRHLITGGQRIDLNGEPAGTISQQAQEFAWETLQHRRNEIYRVRELRKNSKLEWPTGMTLAEEKRELGLQMPRLKSPRASEARARILRPGPVGQP
jgi:sRNA-binding protein